MNRFAKMPLEVFADSRLTLRHLRLLGAISGFANSKGECWPKRETLSKITGFPKTRISEITSQLVTLGWLEKDGNGGRSASCMYRIVTPKTVTKLDAVLDKETVTESVTKRVTKPVTVTETETVTDLGETVTESVTGGVTKSVTKTVTESVTRNITDHEQTNEQTSRTDQLQRGKKTPPANESAIATWNAYSDAYQKRYHIPPLRNAKINGQIAQFVKRVPQNEAPFIAAFFVEHNSSFYAAKLHPVGLLLADAEKLRTEWATNRQMTNTKARQIDEKQTNFDVVQEAMLLDAQEGKV